MATNDDESVLAAYLECALWASTDPDTCEPLDDVYTVDDFAEEARETMAKEVGDFLGYCDREGVDLSALEPAMVGHDFWLTRNHHGAGFWDRGLGELGDRLTALAESFGESGIYPGSDGKLYVS